MRLVVVEDDANLLDILRRQLCKAGHDVCAAPNGRMALDHLRQFGADIVITDWKMPEMTGIELCRAIRAEPCMRGMYIIMLTGQTTASEQIEGIHAGADDYLTKPFRMERLLASIRTAQQVIDKAA
jgi:DNA-binding response OmpR family regulator